MSINEMSTKENTLQLPTQFSNTTNSESESETGYGSFKKRRENHREMKFHFLFQRKKRINLGNGIYS